MADTPQRTIRPWISNRGYLKVYLQANGKAFSFHVHRLVLLAFSGPCPAGMEACHYDGNPINNYFHNLRWDTPQNNCVDTKRHGSRKGVKNGNAKLTETQVAQIRDLAVQGHPQSNIGKIFSASRLTISAIVLRRNWAHIL